MGAEVTGPATPVAVVDDHPLYRAAVAAALEGMAEVVVALRCASMEELERALDRQPDAVQVVLLDLRLPGRGGGDAVRELSRRGIRVLVVSAAAASAQIVEVIAAGARGYLTKAADADEIRTAVRAVLAGRDYVSSTVSGHLSRAVRNRQQAPVVTAREREVLALVAAGLTDRMIAERLTISVPTVRSHLDRIRGKTGSRRRADLTRMAVEQGLLSHPED